MAICDFACIDLGETAEFTAVSVPTGGSLTFANHAASAVNNHKGWELLLTGGGTGGAVATTADLAFDSLTTSAFRVGVNIFKDAGSSMTSPVTFFRLIPDTANNANAVEIQMRFTHSTGRLEVTFGPANTLLGWIILSEASGTASGVRKYISVVLSNGKFHVMVESHKSNPNDRATQWLIIDDSRIVGPWNRMRLEGSGNFTWRFQEPLIGPQFSEAERWTLDDVVQTYLPDENTLGNIVGWQGLNSQGYLMYTEIDDAKGSAHDANFTFMYTDGPASNVAWFFLPNGIAPFMGGMLSNAQIWWPRLGMVVSNADLLAGSARMDLVDAGGNTLATGPTITPIPVSTWQYVRAAVVYDTSVHRNDFDSWAGKLTADHGASQEVRLTRAWMAWIERIYAPVTDRSSTSNNKDRVIEIGKETYDAANDANRLLREKIHRDVWLLETAAGADLTAGRDIALPDSGAAADRSSDRTIELQPDAGTGADISGPQEKQIYDAATPDPNRDISGPQDKQTYDTPLAVGVERVGDRDIAAAADPGVAVERLGDRDTHVGETGTGADSYRARDVEVREVAAGADSVGGRDVVLKDTGGPATDGHILRDFAGMNDAGAAVDRSSDIERTLRDTGAGTERIGERDVLSRDQGALLSEKEGRDAYLTDAGAGVDVHILRDFSGMSDTLSGVERLGDRSVELRESAAGVDRSTERGIAVTEAFAGVDRSSDRGIEITDVGSGFEPGERQIEVYAADTSGGGGGGGTLIIYDSMLVEILEGAVDLEVVFEDTEIVVDEPVLEVLVT